MRDFVKKEDTSWLFFKSPGESECLCMDGKEVTCASAPPAKFRSAKGNDYAGEFFFLQKPLLFIFFSKFTGNRKSAKKGKSGKNLRVRDFAKFCCNILYFHPNLFQFYRQI